MCFTFTFITSLKMNSLNMYGEYVFNSKDRKIKTSIINIFEGATAKISSVEAHEKVIFELNEVMSITDVDLSNLN